MSEETTNKKTANISKDKTAEESSNLGGESNIDDHTEPEQKKDGEDKETLPDESKTDDTKSDDNEKTPPPDESKTDDTKSDQDPDKIDVTKSSSDKTTGEESTNAEDIANKEKLQKRKIMLFVAGGSAIIILTILGVAGWWYFANGTKTTAKETPSKSSAIVMRMPPPKGTASLNTIAENDEPEPEETKSLNDLKNDDESEPQESSALNSVLNDSKSNADGNSKKDGQKNSSEPNVNSDAEDNSPTSLNAILKNEEERGSTLENIKKPHDPLAGLVIPSVLPDAFSSIPNNNRSIGKKEALSSAPIKPLLELKEGLSRPIPKIGEDGNEPWKAYARTHKAGSQPTLGLLIVGGGLSPVTTVAAIQKTPPEVTIVLSPYGSDLKKWRLQARTAGHELFLRLPMESSRFPQEDPGPLALTSALSPEKVISTLDTILGSFAGYVGMVSHMGDQYYQDPVKLETVLLNLKNKGLAFIDATKLPSQTPKTPSPISEIAKKINLNYNIVDIIIDSSVTPEAINEKFSRLEKLAKDNGSAIGIAHPYPITINLMSKWISSLRKKGITLAPVSHLIQNKMKKLAL